MKKFIYIFTAAIFLTACHSIPSSRSVETSLCCYDGRLIRIHMARNFGELRRIFINTYNFSDANVHTWSWSPRRLVCPSLRRLADNNDTILFFTFVDSTNDPRAIAGRAYIVYRIYDDNWFWTSRIQIRR